MKSQTDDAEQNRFIDAEKKEREAQNRISSGQDREGQMRSDDQIQIRVEKNNLDLELELQDQQIDIQSSEHVHTDAK